MQCPLCSIELQLIERKGFEFDYCPKCRGVWLGRSKLDNIVEHVDEEQRRLEIQQESRKSVRDGETYYVRKKSQTGRFLKELFCFP